MKEDLYDDLFDEKEEKTDFQALFFKKRNASGYSC